MTKEEKEFINSFDRSVSLKSIQNEFAKKYGRNISRSAVCNNREKVIIDTWTEPENQIVPIEEAKFCDDWRIYEKLAIAIIKQAYDDALTNIWNRTTWLKERSFFKSGFVNDLYFLDGDYFIRKLEEYEEISKNRRKKKYKEAQHED